MVKRSPGYGKQTESNKGFLLIETRVATLVLAISLVGLAGMQLTAVKNNHSAMLRGEAAIHIANIADRMRANTPAVAADTYSRLYTDSKFLVPEANQAERDINAWLDTISAALPAGQGEIVCLAARSCSISVRWDDSRGTGPQSQGATVNERAVSLTTDILF